MKKIIILMLTVVMAFTMVACSAGGPAANELKIDLEAAEVSADDYEKNLDGLVSYLKDSQTLAGEQPVEMSYDFIGAMAGEKYVYYYNDATITCEIYEFDVENLNETALEVIGSVKDNGHFMSVGNQVEAVITNNEQFVMVFTISSDEEVFVELEEKMIETFTNFA